MSASRLRFVAAAVLAISFAADGAAQAVPASGAVEPGARVRLEWKRPTEGPREGTVVETGDARFTIETAARDGLHEVPFASLERLRVSLGTRSNWGRGLLFGSIGGTLAAAVLLPATSPDADVDFRPLAVIASGVGGGLVGLIIGANISSERWQTVPLP